MAMLRSKVYERCEFVDSADDGLTFGQR
jgi:hypothetical protein